MTIYERARRAADSAADNMLLGDNWRSLFADIIANEFADLTSEIDELRRLLAECREPIRYHHPMNRPNELLIKIESAIGKEPERD